MCHTLLRSVEFRDELDNMIPGLNELFGLWSQIYVGLNADSPA